MLFLLPQFTYACAHLLKQQPFRATDTAQSGGDHICDLRRDGCEEGRPERLGDYVSVCGTVIAEPSTYETGGWLFWIRQGSCGILVYGEQEGFALGDSVEAGGCLRVTNGRYFFPETGLATLGDLAIENMGTGFRGRSENVSPALVSASKFAADPAACGGDLVTIPHLLVGNSASDGNGDTFVQAGCDSDSVTIYIDADIEASPAPLLGRCYAVTGIAVRMMTPAQLGSGPAWCVAPRNRADLVLLDCSSATVTTTWGSLKSR
jgi:hypothetical protein